MQGEDAGSPEQEDCSWVGTGLLGLSPPWMLGARGRSAPVV